MRILLLNYQNINKSKLKNTHLLNVQRYTKN